MKNDVPCSPLVLNEEVKVYKKSVNIVRYVFVARVESAPLREIVGRAELTVTEEIVCIISLILFYYYYYYYY